MLSARVNEIVLFIKKQMQFEEHPIRAIIDKFKSLFVQKNLVLLCKQQDEESEEMLVDIGYEDKLTYVTDSI